MSKRIFFDAGHGGKDPGAVKYVREADVAIKVVKFACAYLKNNFDCEVYPDTTDDSTQTISKRANNWKADLFVSVHFNAGGGDGFEALVYSAKNKSLGECFVEHVLAVGQNSRGVKYRPELNVLRLTKMDAVLCEVAFVDNRSDIKDWDEDHELKVMGEALAKASAEYLGLTSGETFKTLENLNLRKSPDLKSQVLEVIPKGALLVGTEVSGGWLKTTYKKKSGYARIKGQKVYMKKM